MMLGYLLAGAGIEVLVLEKHADFLRDFRGDTVHPSTLEVMSELGLLEQLLKRPHQELRQVRACIGGDDIVLGEMSYLRTRCRFMALMPQWDFLDFLAEQARSYATFHLRMQSEATGLIEENGRIAGIRAKTPAGTMEVRSELVVGADGRNSRVRECAGLTVENVGAFMDSLQFRLPRRADDPQLFVYSDRGKTLVTIDRGDYWHCGFAIPKGAAEKMQSMGIEVLRAAIVEVAPFLRDRVKELRDWGNVKLLTVRQIACGSGTARVWFASAMRPTPCLQWAALGSILPSRTLSQRPTFWQGRFAGVLLASKTSREYSAGALSLHASRSACKGSSRSKSGVASVSPQPTRAPWPLRLLERTTLPCRMRTRFIAVGIGPEHVKTPDVYR